MVTPFDPFGETEAHKQGLQLGEPNVRVRAALENPQKDELAHMTIMLEVAASAFPVL